MADAEAVAVIVAVMEGLAIKGVSVCVTVWVFVDVPVIVAVGTVGVIVEVAENTVGSGALGPVTGFFLPHDTKNTAISAVKTAMQSLTAFPLYNVRIYINYKPF